MGPTGGKSGWGYFNMLVPRFLSMLEHLGGAYCWNIRMGLLQHASSLDTFQCWNIWVGPTVGISGWGLLLEYLGGNYNLE